MDGLGYKLPHHPLSPPHHHHHHSDQRSKALRIAVVGDAFLDGMVRVDTLPRWGNDVLLHEGIQWVPGGSALNTALYLASLTQQDRDLPVKVPVPVPVPVQVELYCAVGDDDEGRTIRTAVESAGVCWKGTVARSVSSQSQSSSQPSSQSQSQPPRTGTCMVLSGRHDRAFLTFGGATSTFALTADQQRDLDTADHVHFGGYFSCTMLQTQIPELCQRWHTNPHRNPTTVDPNSHNPSRTHKYPTVSLDSNGDASHRYTSLRSVLPHLDVFLPNDVEACGVSNTKTPLEACRWFLQETINNTKRTGTGTPTTHTIVTCGPDGVLSSLSSSSSSSPSSPSSVVDQEMPQKYPAIAIDPAHVVDTTGAGDAFDAGFLYGYKVVSSTLTVTSTTMAKTAHADAEAVALGIRYGQACAHFALQHLGASAVRPTLEEVETILEKASINNVTNTKGNNNSNATDNSHSS